MLEDLTTFFKLAFNYRTSNIILQRAILDTTLPDLSRRTKSVRLKKAIACFIQENQDAQSSASRN